MRVVGTAGHVDHGKSTLIEALTGIDPDRLREEKERGMTIDLGFAWLKLPGGQEVSIVDVPGHERFIHNMLAGVGGIDIALLVVAADEGVMPQTREHLDILDLLAVPAGAIVITKTDLVDQDWLELVSVDVAEAVAGTVLEGAPIVPVSAVTRAGLDDLVKLLDQLLERERARPATGRPRLPIDRVFTVAGFGTVVTGTLLDGTLRVGQEVEIQPSGRRTRVRGLQSHRRKLEQATGGTRVAVNLGGVGTDDLVRGEVVTAPGMLQATRLIDVKLRVLERAPRPMAHNMALTFHTGAAETTAKASVLAGREIEPGQTGWVQLRLGADVALAKGDLFIVRTPSPSATIGGGTVVEPHARRHRRNQPRVLERLAALERGTPGEIVLHQLAVREPTDVQSLTTRAGLASDEIRAILTRLIETGEVVRLSAARDLTAPLGPTAYVATRLGWQILADSARTQLAEYHHAHRLRLGMPKEELRRRLGFDTRLFARVFDRLLAEGVVRERGPLLALPEHQVAFTDDEQRRVDWLLDVLRDANASPPGRRELEVHAGMVPEVTAALIERGELVELSDDLIYRRDTLDTIAEQVRQSIQQHGAITVAHVRDLFGTSRKYALALLAHLDEQKITRRVGDERVLF
jgi:selenocysteine-specific elongation factor